MLDTKKETTSEFIKRLDAVIESYRKRRAENRYG